MICISLAEQSAAKISSLLSSIDFAEIRIDALNAPDIGTIKEIFSSHQNLIATCKKGTFPDTLRSRLLETAVDYGAKYIDIDLETDSAIYSPLIDFSQTKGCSVIISHHNFNHTPQDVELHSIINQSIKKHADFIKIACMVTTLRDNARLLSLCKEYKNIIPVGMGELGKITRIAAPFCGALFTYASLNEKTHTAPGQLSYASIKEVFTILEN